VQEKRQKACHTCSFFALWDPVKRFAGKMELCYDFVIEFLEELRENYG